VHLPRVAINLNSYFATTFFVPVSSTNTMQEAESNQLLPEKSTLLLTTIADAKALTARPASRSQEIAALADQRRKYETGRNRLFRDLNKANSPTERIFAVVNDGGSFDSP
jgi:hypothetical protein